MSKDVNRDSVKLHASKRNNSRDYISSINDHNANNVKNKSLRVDCFVDTDTSYKRLNSLRRAIGAGRFIINPTRVAEKLIQFETQLSA